MISRASLSRDNFLGRNKSLCLFRDKLGLNPRAHVGKQFTAQEATAKKLQLLVVYNI